MRRIGGHQVEESRKEADQLVNFSCSGGRRPSSGSALVIWSESFEILLLQA
ncbi:hypothetical protein PM082_002529 [Marasmius tenuissimus]|nr:hypothetical protein PM082_002529 [Marasmius tenuissimus]